MEWVWDIDRQVFLKRDARDLMRESVRVRARSGGARGKRCG
jgi:hypothetical protein